MPIDQVVPVAQETPPQGSEPSSDETQTEEQEQQEQEQQEQQRRERRDYRKLHREDPDLNAYIQSQIDRAIRRRERATLREAARFAAEAKDPAQLQAVAEAVATDMDEDDEHDATWTQAAERVQPHLERLLRLNDQGLATNEWYIRLHQREGKGEMDRRYAEDPQAFLDWVEDQLDEMKLNARLQKVAPTLARGMAEEQVNQRLQRLPQGLNGGAGSGGGLSLEAYEGMTPEAREKLRKENPRAIDDMVRRYA